MQREAQIAAHLGGVAHAAALSRYGALLARREFGQLVSDPSPAVVAERHLLDSVGPEVLAALPAEGRAVDVGSGAGLPGVALAIAGPGGLRWTLLESQARRCAFLELVRDELALDVDVVADRAERLGRGPDRRGFAVATARAVAGLDVLIELCVPLLAPGGILLAWKGRRDAAEVAAGERAAALLRAEAPVWTRLPDGAGERVRHLVGVRAGAEVPDRYPRRDGVPAKRPLGAAPGG